MPPRWQRQLITIEPIQQGNIMDYPDVEVRSVAELRSWLRRNHRQSSSIWLVTYKKGVPAYYIAHRDIVAEALCFGWIDSQPREVDAQRSKRLLSPRKATSAWSRVNKILVQELIATGRMTRAGLAKVTEAQGNGSWNKLDEVETLRIPEDLSAALDKTARAHFMAFPRSSQRLILEWIVQAKKPETRARRIAETAALAAENIRAHHYRQPKNAPKRRRAVAAKSSARRPS